MCPITASIAERRRSSRLMRIKDATLLAGDEDAVRIGGVVAAIALVDIGALDCATGELLGGVDDAAERMSVVGTSRQSPWRGAQTGRRERGHLSVTIEALTPNRSALALPLPMHSTSGAWKE